MAVDKTQNLLIIALSGMEVVPPNHSNERREK